MNKKNNISKKDKRNETVQSIKIKPNFFSLDIHKSMFINDLMISLPKYYVESWGANIINKHNKENYFWNVKMNYEGPKELNNLKEKFNVKLTLSFAKSRSKESSYRLKWGKDFSIKLAKDYPKSFVRSLEYHIGMEYYNKKGFSEYDVGGFKEQLQVKIQWKNGLPQIFIKEFFRVKDESQGFPKIFKELSSYLISDYLLGSEDEIIRRIQIGNWKPRNDIGKELNENNIYILLNRDTKEVYFGETKKSLSKRYPENQEHHSFKNWTEYCIIQLPPETTNQTRLLIERVLIATGSKLFKNFFDKKYICNEGLILKNKKK